MTITAETGKPFKFKFTNSSNFYMELNGDIDISRLTLEQTKSSPYPTPSFDHMGGSKIKIIYNQLIPNNLIVEYIFKSRSLSGTESVSLWSKISPFFKAIIKKSLLSVIIVALFGVAIYSDNKYNDGKVGDWLTPSVWFAERISDSEKSVKSIDTRILTNDHAVYESEGFLEAESLVNENIDEKIEDLRDDIQDFRDEENISEAEKLEIDLAKYESERVSLKDEYWFLGNGLFVFRGVLTKGGGPLLVSYDVAEDFCDMIGAEVLSTDEHKTMGGLLEYITSFFTVKDDSKVPEWTRTESDDSDYNIILMKSSIVIPDNSKSINGQIAGDTDDTKAAFRCSMNAYNFVGAE